MLYLFLTGKNGAYLNDIFTTLYLPEGMLHRYKYNCRADSTVIHDSVDLGEKGTGEGVLISYIDREATQQEKYYIPLRKGELVRTECIDGQCYFTVRLCGWCHAKNEDLFSQNLRNRLGDRLYQENGSQEWKGCLVMKAGEPEASDLSADEKSWRLTAERLSRRTLFRNCYSIFTRLEIKDSDGNVIRPVEYEEESGFELTGKKKYRLYLSYYIPLFNANTMTRIPVVLEEACGALKTKHYMESRQNVISTPLYPEDTEKRKNTVFSVVVPVVDMEGKTVRYSPEAVNVWVRSRMNRWVRSGIIALCVLGITVASAWTAVPCQEKGLCAVLCGLLMSVSTYFMVKFTGKPKL